MGEINIKKIHNVHKEYRKMNFVNPYWFNTPPNTFIGGVSATINTPAIVAAKLGISVGRIKSFKIVGSNIEFAITGGTYTIPTNAFNGITSLTYYNDVDGLVTTVNPGTFVGCTSATYYTFPNLTTINSGTSIGTGAFQNNTLLSTLTAPKLATIIGNYTFSCLGPTATNITALNFPLLTGSLGISTFGNQGKLITFTHGNITSIGAGCFAACAKLKAFNCSYLTFIPDTAFKECKELDSIVNMDLVIAIGTDSFRECYMLPDFSATAVTTLGIRSFYFTKAVRNYYFPALTTINCGTGAGTGTFQNSWGVLTFSAPNLITINGNYCFNGWDKVTSINMPSLTKLGTTVGNDSHFTNIKTGCAITVKTVLQTANAGAPDGDLVYAVGTRSAIVTYV